MTKLEEIKSLKAKAAELCLNNSGIIAKYTDDELCGIYNGIGSSSMPEWLRSAVSALHPSLAVVAFIHDIEWHESDGSKENFTASNNRFTENGIKVAKALYGWWNPRRYLVIHDAKKFGNICQQFGWNGWASPCTCTVCRKKGEIE